MSVFNSNEIYSFKTMTCAATLLVLVALFTTSRVSNSAELNLNPDSAVYQTIRVSVATDGTQSTVETTGEPVLSTDGRFIAYDSLASDLVAGDTNDSHDVFVHDRFTGETERVSVASDGRQGNGTSWGPSISADGRLVVFSSDARLDSGLYADAWHIYVHDRETGETRRVSVASGGVQVDGSSIDQAAISADGRIVAFTSETTNLVVGDSNNAADIFLHDLETGETTRVSVASDGTQGDNYSVSPALSADGRYVTFASWASNLIVDDINGVSDVFVHDRQTGQTTLISTRLEGVGTSQDAHIPAISAEGQWVAFMSRSSDFVTGDSDNADIFIVDRTTGKLTLVSVNSEEEKGNEGSDRLAISADGRFVAFDSDASNLVPDDTNGRTDVFVRDLEMGVTRRASLGNGGEQGNGGSFAVGISPDGFVVGFASDASNLIPNDTNDEEDLFVRVESVGAAWVYLPMVRTEDPPTR